MNINFRIISFKHLLSYRFQSDSHLLLHQAWIIKMTMKVFLLFEIYIYNCRAAAFVGMWKGNLIFLADYLNSNWDRELVRVGQNWPLSSFRSLYTQYSFFLSRNCYASSKIIYPTWMLWICFSGFPFKLIVGLIHYINLFYVSWRFSTCLPFGFDVVQKAGIESS